MNVSKYKDFLQKPPEMLHSKSQRQFNLEKHQNETLDSIKQERAANASAIELVKKTSLANMVMVPLENIK